MPGRLPAGRAVKPDDDVLAADPATGKKRPNKPARTSTTTTSLFLFLTMAQPLSPPKTISSGTLPIRCGNGPTL
jgi:hypothetical protein